MGLALFFFFLLTTSVHQPIGDEEEYAAVAENILLHGTPAIVRPQSVIDGRQTYAFTWSKFPLGQSLVLFPFVSMQLISRDVFPVGLSFIDHLILNSLPASESAVICGFLFLLIRLLGVVHSELNLSLRASLALALTTGVATQMWPSSRTLFSDNSVAFLVTFAIYALVRFRFMNAAAGWLIAAAWAAALMVLCKNLFFLACPALAAYGYWAVMEHKKQRRWISNGKLWYFLVTLAVPFFLVAALQFWYNDLRYGSIWPSGYHQGRDGEFGFSTPLFVGLYGIFFSSGRSLFLYSPPCLLAFLGARHFFKHAPAETALLAGVSLPVIFAYAKWWSWHGGWEWGARFYLFLIPLLMLLSVPAWRWIDPPLSIAARRMRLAALAVLVAASLGVQTLGLLIHPAAYWFVAAKELNISNHPVYEKGVWEIRDDMLFPHFVPEFSPVAAHAWLVWATWNRQSMNDTALTASAPWVSLNPQWAPKSVRPYLGFDLWFFGDWPTGPKVMTALVLLAFTIFCGLKLRRVLQELPFSRS